MSHHPAPLEILGLISTNYASETHAPTGSEIDKAYVGAFARAHEYAGFDRVLVGYRATAPDGFQIVAYAAQQTTKLKFLLAHRPGFIAPTLAARQLATLDQFSDGRLAVHIITGGSDEDQQRDGDFLAKADRYARSEEYISILKTTWTSAAPFDHEGAHYRLKGAFSSVKPVQRPHPPVFFGGSSDEAVAVAGRQADVYALFGEPVEQAREVIERVRASAAANGRQVEFSVSLRPILGRTEAEAWARAEHILEQAKALRAGTPSPFYSGSRSEARGAQRLQEAAAGGRVRDKRLWTEIAALNGGQGNSTSLVGTPDQVVDSLLDYYDLGVTKFLFRGFDPLEDALEYGRYLLPALRDAVAHRGAPAILAAE